MLNTPIGAVSSEAMAYAIIGGLFVATLLTLLFLPALYVAWFRVKEPAKEQQVGVPEPARAVTV